MLNTYFSLAASTLATFVLWPVLYEEDTLGMVSSLLGQPMPPALPTSHLTRMVTLTHLGQKPQLGFLRALETQFDL